MSYLQISNFKYGLDTRRNELTSQPGSLAVLTDGHINQGGEIEKRKAFSLFAKLPSPVYGLEATTSGLVSFGSIAPPTMPTGIVYQRLIDPAGGNMTGYINSTQFNGLAFVLANFDSSLTWPFYNSTLVAESVNGKVLTTNQTTLAQNLANLIAALPGFFTSAVTTAGGFASFQFWSQAGVNFSVILVMGSGSTGLVTTTQLYSSVPQIPAVAATGGFQITGGSSALSGGITSVKVNGVEIYNTTGSVPTLPFNDSAGTGTAFDAINNNQTAADLVYKINLGISTPQYSAVANANMVTIADNASQGVADNGYVVQVTTVGDMCVDDASFKFTGSVNGDTCTGILAGATQIMSGTVTRGVSDTDITFAAAVAANIVAFHGTSGYTASTVSGTTTVRVSKLVRNSNDAVPANLAVTTAGTVAVAPGTSGSTNTGVGLAVSVSPLQVVFAAHQNTGIKTVGPITGVASGGKPPYTYLWEIVNSFGNNWTVNSPTTASSTFSAFIDTSKQRPINGTAHLTVTDTAAVSVKSQIVSLVITP